MAANTLRAHYTDREVSHIRARDTHLREQMQSIVGTWWGLIHVRTAGGKTFARMIWRERLYERTYEYAYSYRLHGRIAWEFARDITQSEREEGDGEES
jgi:hypothetical protein